MLQSMKAGMLALMAAAVGSARGFVSGRGISDIVPAAPVPMPGQTSIVGSKAPGFQRSGKRAAHVKRAARKARNVARNKAAHRG